MSTDHKTTHIKTAVSYAYTAVVVEDITALQDNPILQQQNEIRKKAQELNAKIVMEFYDMGKPIDPYQRSELQKMMKHIRHIQIDYVIFNNMTRLSRNMDMACKTLSDIEKTGATPVSVINDLSAAKVFARFYAKQIS